MDNTRRHVGREQEFEAFGRTWRLSRWELREWNEILERARRVIPNPKVEAAELIKLVGVESPVAAKIAKDALDLATDYLSITSKGVQQFISSVEGSAYVVYVLLKGHQDDVTEDDAYSIILAVGQERMRELLELCAGKPPGKAGSPGGGQETAQSR